MFSSPLGLLALLAVPAVVALHLLRRRFQPRVVSALFLWAEADRDPAEGRRWEKLRASVSLLLECLAAALLALALAGPRGCEEAGRHLVIVLDGSASMAAKGDDGVRAAQRAREAVEDRLDGLSGRDRVTLIQSGPHPAVLAGPAAPRDEARAALSRWSPTGPDADPSPALALARALADGGAALWVTDALPERSPDGVETLAVGAPADNVGIIDASRDDQGLLLTLASFAATPTEGTLALEPGGDPTPWSLPPGGRARLRVSLSEGTGPVTARLQAVQGPWSDGLDLDDSVTLVSPVHRVVRLGSELPAAMGRALGLSAGPLDATGVGRWVAAVPDSLGVGAAEADLVMTRADRVAPGAWGVRISGPASADAPSEARALAGPFLPTGHPLMAGWSGQGLIWTPGTRVAVGDEDLPLLIAGDRALILAHPEGAPIHLTLDLDPWRSTLARTADWPILLAALAEERRASLPGLRSSNFRAGEAISWPGAGTGEARLSGPDGARTLPARGDLLLEDLAPGVYTLTPPQGEAQPLAINLLSPAESDLRDRGSGSRGEAGAPAEAAVARGGAASALGLVALALLLLDWVLLNRRRR